MRRRKGNPTPIMALMEDVAASLGKRELFDFAAIFGRWEEVVGRALADVSSPSRVSRKTLTVEVAEPVWADSMGYMKKEIIEKANRILGRGAISKIKMEIRKGGSADKRKRPAKAQELPQTVIKEAEDAARHIEDSQLRAAFKRIILKDVGLKYSLTEEKTKS